MMPFSLSCGDVLPGCAARFEGDTREAVLARVADHAAADHGITDITPEVRRAVESAIHAA